MRLVFGKQDMPCLERTRENCWLLVNGLGGFASLTGAFSASRLDHSLLMAAASAPAVRVNLVHRLQERLEAEGERVCLSTQEFAGGRTPEEGFRHLSYFVWEDGPAWLYHVRGVQVERRCAMAQGANISAVLDDGSLTMVSAVELSYLPEEEQAAVKKVMDQSCIRLKADKAGELRKAAGSLSEGKAQEILGVDRSEKPVSVKLPARLYSRYFSNVAVKDVQGILEEALEQYFKGKGA